MTLPPALSQFAAQEFTRRQRSAPAAIAARQTTRDKANHDLRCWLAIACLAGADVPELADGIAALRVTQVYRPASTPKPAAQRQASRHDAAGGISGGVPSAAWRTEEISEAEARRLLAAELAPDGLWREVLLKATQSAFDKANTPETSARAAQLRQLCAALRVPFVYFPKEVSA
jgi:hypothetical protein